MWGRGGGGAGNRLQVYRVIAEILNKYLQQSIRSGLAV